MGISSYQFLISINNNDNVVDQLYAAVVMTMVIIAIVTNYIDDIIDNNNNRHSDIDRYDQGLVVMIIVITDFPAPLVGSACCIIHLTGTTDNEPSSLPHSYSL